MENLQRTIGKTKYMFRAKYEKHDFYAVGMWKGGSTDIVNIRLQNNIEYSTDE
jgi:hypothetical protein